ncbi:MAG TPA: hypothetical protein VGM87_15810 [Roseomonas sp.]|jgi:hypothetical protein
MSNATLAADQAQRWVLEGKCVGWTNHQPASSLVQWSRARANGNAAAPPAVDLACDMVCYELPIWAAYSAGVLTADGLYDMVREYDHTNHGSAAGIMKAITSRWSFRKTLTNAAMPSFSRGDIVFFNDVGHVAMATGNAQVPNELYSVWGMNPAGMQPNTPVERTSVGRLLAQIALGAPGLAQTITYSSPRW